MKLRSSIKNKTFLQDLIKILESEKAEKFTFDQFTWNLWQFLCGLKKRELTSLEKQLNIRNKYFHNGNIGNINLEIVNQLGIGWMDNYYKIE